jgi:hypothetical protein
MNFGEAAIGAEAAKGALPSGIDPLSEQAASYEIGQAAANKAARAGATNFDRLSRGVTEGFKNPMGAFSAIGGGSKLQGAAMIGAPLLSAISSQDATSVPTAEQIRFDPRYANINISRQQNPYQPDTGSSGERSYFGPTNVTQYGADGGFVSNNEIQHFAYGGGTIDPNYNYSGYGNRNASSAMQPITSVEAPKPDFVGADGKTYRYDPIKKSWYVIKEAEEKKVNAGVETLMGGDGGSPAGGENPAARPEGSYDISSNINPYTGSINALANGPVGTAVGKIAGLFGPQVSLNNAPVEDGTGTLTQAGKDYGKSSWGKTGDEGQDIGTVAPKGSTSTTGSDALASITRDVEARAAAAGMTTADFAEQGLAEVSARAQAESNDRPGGVGVAEGNYGEGLAGGYEKANGGMIGHYAQGGLGSLGGYSDGGRLLRGPGDGVSDSIPASIGNRQPARLADGECVVPARIVSELGNGSTEAGARALYKMMDRIQANRRKTTGKNRVAVNSKSHKYLPA